MGYIPAFFLPVTITSANCYLKFSADAIGDVTATITTGTYDNIYELLQVIPSACNAASTAGYISDCTLHLTSSAYLGRVELETNASGSQTWYWSATGSIGSTLGFGTTNTTGTATVATAHTGYTWFPGHAPEDDTYDRRQHVGGEARRTLSGTNVKRLTVAKPRIRTVTINNLARSLVFTSYATGNYTNRSFETFWDTAIEGTAFQYWTDYTASTGSGTYYLTMPDDLSVGITRVGDKSSTAELYSVTLEMKRKES